MLCQLQARKIGSKHSKYCTEEGDDE